MKGILLESASVVPGSIDDIRLRPLGDVGLGEVMREVGMGQGGVGENVAVLREVVC